MQKETLFAEEVMETGKLKTQALIENLQFFN